MVITQLNFNRLRYVAFFVFLTASASVATSVRAEDAWGGIRLLAAELSASNQTTVTESNGSGVASFTFDIHTKQINWSVEYEGLTSELIGVNIHGPARVGQNGDALIDLGENGLRKPITGSAEMSDSNIEYMMLGWTYVLLKTRKYPDGEIRGKIDMVPPPGFKKDAGVE